MEQENCVRDCVRECVKISVVYDSVTENTATMAEYIVSGISGIDGVEARAFHINEVDEEYVKASAGVIFGCPTYVAGPTSRFYEFLEKRAGKLGLAGKLGGVFATEQYIHGGADLTMVSIIEHLLTFGMMVYSGGGSHGVPVIHIGPAQVSPDREGFQALFVTFGERFGKQVKMICGNAE